MTSAGGLVPVGRGGRAAGRRCSCRARPAGCGRGRRGRRGCGFPDAVTFDMGGTSTDVCLVRGGAPEPAAERSVAGLPDPPARRSTSTPSAPAAGRSPRIDPGGALAVGPRSAGADPGPGLLRPGRHGADRHRRRPGRSAASPPTPRFAGLGRARPSTRPRPPSTRAGVDRRRRDRRRRRGHGAGGAGRVGGAGRRPRAAWPSWPSAAPGRCTPAPLAEALGHGRGGRAAPGRRAVGRRPAVRAAPARPGAVVAHAGATTPASTTALADAGRPRRPAAVGGGDAEVDARRSTAATRARATSCTVAVGRRLRRRAPAPQRLRPPGHAGRGRGPPGHAPAGRRRSTSPTWPAAARARPVAGPAVIAEPDCTVWVPEGWPADVGPPTARWVADDGA